MNSESMLWREVSSRGRSGVNLRFRAVPKALLWEELSLGCMQATLLTPDDRPKNG